MAEKGNFTTIKVIFFLFLYHEQVAILCFDLREKIK